MNKQHLVIGTAGHIDHGKSALVEKITNINPMRLKEEKEKNITIDLGFSYFYLNEQPIGIIDLPGHEKFIANMIVGSSNVDMILFVIAADDGIMPQTIEHFEILSLLKIKHALIVLNKTDLVSPELLKQRHQEIKDFFMGTIFENAPIVETSIYDEKSLAALKKVLIAYIETHAFIHHNFDIFRMAIDRSFVIKGLGTIVTGTSQGKELFVNETLEVFPSKKIVKVKNIQNHNVDVPSITSGHRTALQLSKISKNEIKRGAIIASPNSLKPSRYLDVIITPLKKNKLIKNNQLIRIFHQTKEFIGRLKLPCGSLEPDRENFATIFLNEDCYALKGDLAIIRQFSPIKTIAGVEIVNTLEHKPKISEKYYERYLLNDISQQIINYLKEKKYANEHQINLIAPNKKEIERNLHYLVAQDKIKVFIYNNKPQYILAEDLAYLGKQATLIVEAYHEDNPLFDGIPSIELYKKMTTTLNQKVFKALIPLISTLKIKQDLISLQNFKVNYTLEQKKRRNAIMTTIKNNGYSLFTFEELTQKFNEPDDKLIIQNMINQKQLLIIAGKYLILDRMYASILDFLKKTMANEGKIYLSAFKDNFKISRKYCLALLDHFDNEKITKREEDYRILIKNF